MSICFGDNYYLKNNELFNEDNNLIIYDIEHYFNFNSNIPIFESYMEYKNILLETIDKDEGFGNILRPVLIVLLYSDSNFDHVAEKFVKGQKYWHAALSFGPSLKHCYSFNFGEADANKRKGGLSFESLDFYKKEHPTGTMEVSCIVLGKDKYDKLKETLNYYIRNKEKTKYDFVNLLRSLFGKATPDGNKFNLVCSTFVDTILKSVDVNISKAKAINLTKPDDLRAMRRNEKQFKVYSGNIVNYNVNKVTDKVDKLTQDANNNYFKETEKNKE